MFARVAGLRRVPGVGQGAADGIVGAGATSDLGRVIRPVYGDLRIRDGIVTLVCRLSQDGGEGEGGRRLGVNPLGETIS